MNDAETAELAALIKDAPAPHYCHWTGCKVEVPRERWGCGKHWYMLPQRIRLAIQKAYRPGQERGLVKVGQAYIDAARAAREWIARQQGPPKMKGDSGGR